VMERLSSKQILHEAQPEHKRGYIAIAGDTFMAEIVVINDPEGVTPFSSINSVRSIDPSSLKSRGDRLGSRWTHVIGTKAVARWACDAASAMARDFMDHAPSGGLKEMMEQYFRKPFSASPERVE
jgi:hypothetical protein